MSEKVNEDSVIAQSSHSEVDATCRPSLASGTTRGAYVGAAVLILGFLLAYSAASEQLAAVGAGPGVAGRLAIIPAAGMAIVGWLFAAMYCGRRIELSAWTRAGVLVCAGSAGMLSAVQSFLAISSWLHGHVVGFSRQNVLSTEGLLLVLLGGFLFEVRAAGSLQPSTALKDSEEEVACRFDA